MKKIFTIFIIIGLFIPFSSVKAQSIDELNRQLQELFAKRTTLSKQILTSRQKAAEKKAEAERIAKEIKNLEAVIISTEQKISTLGVQIVEKEGTISTKTQEIVQKESELNKEITKQYDTIKVIYEIGSSNSILSLITSNSISEAVDKTSYLSALEARLEKNIAEINRLKDELIKQKEDLQKQRNELESIKTEQQKFKFGLDRQKDTKRGLLKDVRVQQAEFEKIVEDAKKEYTNINSELYRITESARSRNKRTGDKKVGDMVFSWPNSGAITANFGVPTPVQSYHTGTDIDGQIGDSILAASDGTVSFTGGSSTYGYGLYIKLDHGSGVETLYGHLSGFTVSEGDTVKRGELIGYMGNTGFAIAFGSGDGSHLHFEVREDGVPVNPLIYLP
ncbi:MAG: Peptidase M23 [Berkelbacteria bacterium GW2011_GWA2_35_9]|uniref:Peptidase M23 n=1 Tax=Berkelbacteria bacterium GW2011_GWA2_35_9 TaxID=1618333 RepID=A0A0G0D775_9BACT|nr:MAG: Peptidase M23 [Berkelbacteria bacterium GW2011_GWA2_35_9]